jgi:hypothetical protein
MINEVFPGTTFTLAEQEPEVTLPWWAAILASKQRLPRWDGVYDGDGFIAEFSVPATSVVKRVGITLYGQGSVNADRHLDKLQQRFGWRTRF